MKICGLLVLVPLMLISMHSFSQPSNEALIRKLEDQERMAILKGDTVQLARLLSRKVVVQNPENAIVGFRQVMDRIKTGKINYSQFERRIDKISFSNGIAIVMGLETLIPQGNTQHANKTVLRRFTNIWTKEKEDWKLTARQATIVSTN